MAVYAEDYEQDEYAAVREYLAPQYRNLPPEQVEAIVAEAFGGMSPEDAEDFFRDVGRAFSSAGRTVAQHAPGVLSGIAQGATTGASVGGPWGALIGGLGGGVLGGVQSATGAARVPRQPVPAAIPGAGLVSGGAGGQLAGGGAASQLLTMLAQPQTVQALLSSVLGAAGQRTVQAGGMPIPVGAILNALSTFATRATEEYSAYTSPAGESVPAYLMDAEGQYAIDPANPDGRALRVLEMLTESNLAAVESYGEDFEYDEDWEYDAEAEYFDMLELLEIEYEDYD